MIGCRHGLALESKHFACCCGCCARPSCFLQLYSLAPACAVAVGCCPVSGRLLHAWLLRPVPAWLLRPAHGPASLGAREQPRAMENRRSTRIPRPGAALKAAPLAPLSENQVR